MLLAHSIIHRQCNVHVNVLLPILAGMFGYGQYRMSARPRTLTGSIVGEKGQRHKGTTEEHLQYRGGRQ